MNKFIAAALKASIIFALTLPNFAYAKSDAQKVLSKKWFQVETPHFTLVTDSSRASALRVAKNLEKFRVMFHSLTGTQLPERSRRVKIVATKKKLAYRMLANNEKLNSFSGFFHDSINGNYALVRLGYQDNFNTIFHEYVHYLDAQMRVGNRPKWYSEGIAQYFSTMSFRGDKDVIYGRPSTYSLNYLDAVKWIPLEQILASKTILLEDKLELRKFHSQSWVLVHYLWSDDTLLSGARKYLSLVAEGMSIEDAVQQAFNMTISELDQNLHAYARRNFHRYSQVTLNLPFDLDEIEVRRLNKDEASFQLGEFLLQSRFATEKAKEFFEISISENQENANSLAGLANIYMATDFERSKSLIDKAKAENPNSQWVATVSGHINKLGYSSAKYDNEKLQYWNSAIRDYNIAVAGDNPSLEALSSVADLYAEKRDWKTYYQVVGSAMQIAPSNMQVRYMAIIASLNNNQLDSAEEIADLIRTSNHMSLNDIEEFNKWYSALLSAEKAA